MRTKTLWIRDEFLQQILQGYKTIEIRVGYENIRRLSVGDLLLLNDRYAFRIVRIGRYPDFEQLIANEDPGKFAPGVPRHEVMGLLRAAYPIEKERLGVLALEVEAVQSD